MGTQTRRLDQMFNDVNEGTAISRTLGYDPKYRVLREIGPDDDPDTIKQLNPEDATHG